MSCSESMARVNANAHPALVIDLVDDIPQILPRSANDVAMSTHILDDSNHRLGGSMGFVELLSNARQGTLAGFGSGRARVEVVEFDAQCFAS